MWHMVNNWRIDVIDVTHGNNWRTYVAHGARQRTDVAHCCEQRTDVAHGDTQRTYLVMYLVITEDKCGPCDMAPKVTKIREMKQILPAVAH